MTEGLVVAVVGSASAAIGSVVVAAVGWLLNQREKREAVEYARREARYRQLLAALRGFYEETADPEMRVKFLDQVNLCWLYCPDEVIRRAYAFLETVQTGAATTGEAKNLAAGELVAAVRRDLISRERVTATRLNAEDFRHLGAAHLEQGP